MTPTQTKLISTILTMLKPKAVIEEDKLAKLVKAQADLLSFTNPEVEELSEDQKKEVVAEIQSHLAVRMDRGACVKKDHVSWYFSAKSKIDDKFWERYRTYLYKYSGFNSDVVSAIDESTDEMMDLLGNPMAESDFKRRGLVIGDVQSGKTSNYIALMNKAADAGYRIIILLTGTIEKLRRQTQGRVDAGFVGLDSTAFNRDKNDVLVGVGEIDSRVTGWSVTSTTGDFNTSMASKLTGKLQTINAPVVFVLKKNKSVLEKLENWLRIFNANPVTKKIELPLLLIDDEADNASVNTKGNNNPTTINKYIRMILKLFSKSSYVGFTATPYANIFIDPDSNEDMLSDDLFPSDFIYALEPPTNYIGADGIFRQSGIYHYMLHDNDDCESYIPLKHDKSYQPGKLPQSLCGAIASFMITNAIRDLRGDPKKHRTMMINISIYIDVQKRIAEQLSTYVREMQREIKNYYMMGDAALRYSSFALLKEAYDKYYSNVEVSWEEIQKALHEAVAPIVVRYVNGGNAAKTLNYDELDEKEGQDGLRVIAVGGYSLSRGLTLEGLCISYFYRNTKMYDTLMQMGRWFGYRPNYKDLCQIWINSTAIEWYSYISEASSELKREVRSMMAEKRTPKDFGLCVRSDKAALLVTARNKMKTAQDYIMTVSLSGTIVDTPFVHTSREITHSNLVATQRFIEAIEATGISATIRDKQFALYGKPQYFGVPKQLILDFLRTYKNHTMNSRFDTAGLINMISSDMDGSLDNWDICIATGDADLTITLGSNSTKCVERSFAIREKYAAYQMSGKNSKLGNEMYAKTGLLAIDAAAIEEGEHNLQRILYGEERSLNQDVYLKPDFITRKRNPILVIYPVQLIYNPKTDSNHDVKKEIAVKNCVEPLIGISVGIPRIKGVPIKRYQYKINIVKYRELMEISNSENEEDESIEE